MSTTSLSQLSICWLFSSRRPNALETLRRRVPNARIDSFALEGLIRADGRSKEFLDIVERSRASDAVLIEWEIESAPVISILRIQTTVPDVPFIALDTVESGEAHVLARLMWADDVLVPPITERMIRASIQSHHRSLASLQDAPSGSDEQASDAIEKGPVRLEVRAHRVRVRDTEIRMTPLHFKLLRYFMEHSDELVTRTELMKNVWDIDYERSSNSVDVSVCHLRSRLAPFELASCIETVRGEGYRFVVPESD